MLWFCFFFTFILLLFLPSVCSLLFLDPYDFMVDFMYFMHSFMLGHNYLGIRDETMIGMIRH